VTADVSNEEDVKRMVAATVTEYGRLDGAFNNASELLVNPRVCSSATEPSNLTLSHDVVPVRQSRKAIHISWHSSCFLSLEEVDQEQRS
jgi:NAD(P)-dependent dehydrogenase (short-subunit alcohol dehydrogenase family)